jgi:hypothetical protein
MGRKTWVLAGIALAGALVIVGLIAAQRGSRTSS